MKIETILDRVVIDPELPIEQTSSGIFIPHVARQKQLRGTVVSIGPKVRQVSLGDIVVYQQYAGGEIEFKGKRYVQVSEDEILMIL